MLPPGGHMLSGQKSSMTFLFPHWAKPGRSPRPSDFLHPLAKMLTVRDILGCTLKPLLWSSSPATVHAIKTPAQNHFKHAEGICGSTSQEGNLPCRNLLNCVCSPGKTSVKCSDTAWRAHVIKTCEIWHTLLTACWLWLLYRFLAMFKKQFRMELWLLHCWSAPQQGQSKVRNIKQKSYVSYVLMVVHMLGLITELEVFNLNNTVRKYKDFYSLWSTQVQSQSYYLNISHCKIFGRIFDWILLLSKSFFNVYCFKFLTLSSDRCNESNRLQLCNMWTNATGLC